MMDTQGRRNAESGAPQKKGGEAAKGFEKIATLLKKEERVPAVDGKNGNEKPKGFPVDNRNILLDNEPAKTPVRDPLFAARVLEQENAPLVPQSEKPKEKSAAASAARGKRTQSGLKRVRTYQGDVAEALKNKKTSMVQVVLAEQRKKDRKKELGSPTARKNIPFVALAVIFSVLATLALSGIAFFFIKKITAPVPPAPIEVYAPVFAETKKEINISKLSGAQLAEIVGGEVRDTNIRLDFIQQLYFTEDIERGEGAEKNVVKVLATPQRFFTLLGTKMPDSLLRSFGGNFMFGVHSFNGNQPFIILNTEFFESTFAGMLKWEEFMAKEILSLFGRETTAALRNKAFDDLVVKNKDLRVLYNEDGEIVLLYAFFNRKTLIVATDTETLDEIISRLNRPRETAL